MIPEATDLNPTQCIALAIEGSHIQKTIQYLNEFFPKASGSGGWQLDYNECHFYNNEDIAYLINRIVRICSDTSAVKDVLADLTMKELLVRIMQTQNLNNANANYSITGNASPLSYIVGYIKANIGNKIHIDELSSRACMSKPTFYRAFKKEFGLSPLEYILKEKINRSKELLSHASVNVTTISYELGFSDVNYFIRLFKKLEGITPGQYIKSAGWSEY